jgi:hypothetical protein
MGGKGKRKDIEARTIRAYAEHIVQTTLVAVTRRNCVGVMEHFKDQFILSDHASELEFADKAQLMDCLTLNRKLFPDSKRADKSASCVQSE